MAGERYASITIRTALSHNDNQRGNQTAALHFTLAGQVITLRRGGQPGEFTVPDPDDVGEGYALQAVQNMLGVLYARIAAGNLPYSISAARQNGTTPDPNQEGATIPLIEFDITATSYGRTLNIAFDYDFNVGWIVVQRTDNVTPVQATAVIVNAGIFGSATGSITITATGGDSDGAYLYLWDDGSRTASRPNLRAGSYPLTVRDLSTLASVRLVPEVQQDPQLVVAVATTDDSITLTVSGGVAPYTYAWADGPTTAVRTGLAAATYRCRVTDAHGATVDVEVTLSAYQFFWSRNAITLPLDAGDAYRADPSTKPNLSFLCQVWLEQEYLSGTFVQVGPQLEQPADAEGRTVFEVQALLDAYLDYHVPAPDQAAVVRAAPLFRRFFLRHAQQYGATPTPQPSIALERNYVAKGGLSFYESQARTWFTDYQARVQPFLTWEPATKPVLPDQPEFLYYMVQGSPGSFKRRLRVTFDDGTELTRELSGADSVRDFEVYCLPVSYQALGLAALAGEGQRVVQWQVWVSKPGGATVLSETRTYRLDQRPHPQRRYLLFATSLGGMATYAALGEAQQDGEVTGSETALSLPASYDPLAGDVAVQARALRPVLKLAAGKRTQAQLLASQDLLLSRRVLLLGPGRWLAGYVKAKTVPLFDEGKLVQVQELEFILPTEQLYTPNLS